MGGERLWEVWSVGGMVYGRYGVVYGRYGVWEVWSMGGMVYGRYLRAPQHQQCAAEQLEWMLGGSSYPSLALGPITCPSASSSGVDQLIWMAGPGAEPPASWDGVGADHCILRVVGSGADRRVRFAPPEVVG
jgi:hypothetical protein